MGDMTLPETCKKQRKELGLSQFEISKRCGWKTNVYGMFERGKQTLSQQDFAIVADQLGLNICREEDVEDEHAQN